MAKGGLTLYRQQLMLMLLLPPYRIHTFAPTHSISHWPCSSLRGSGCCCCYYLRVLSVRCIKLGCCCISDTHSRDVPVLLPLLHNMQGAAPVHPLHSISLCLYRWWLYCRQLYCLKYCLLSRQTGLHLFQLLGS